MMKPDDVSESVCLICLFVCHLVMTALVFSRYLISLCVNITSTTDFDYRSFTLFVGCFVNFVPWNRCSLHTRQEDDLAFGKATRYLELSLDRVEGGGEAWDRAVYEASETYKGRMHNLCCDNCHSHVSMALNIMRYNGSTSYNMVWMAGWMFFQGRYVGFWGFFLTWFPSLLIYGCLVVTLTLIK